MRKWGLGGLLALVSAVSFAQGAPGTLQEWKEVLQQEQTQNQCDSGALSCVWPGRLSIETTEKTGSFQQQWFLLQESLVPLPGDLSFWPQQVQEQGKALVVINQDGKPWVKLSAGQHTINGQWSWGQSPNQLALPDQIAWWDWRHNDQWVSSSKDNQFLVRQTSQSNIESKETAQWRVFKRWIDQPVPQVEVLLSFNVSGSPREITLPPIAEFPRFLPLSLQSAWPTELQPDGSLRIQVSPGQQDIRVLLRCQDQCEQPFKATGVAPFEYWALQSDPLFRSLAWKDLSNVDPRQINAPEEWHNLSWIRVEKNQNAQWEVKSKGPDTEAENLTLVRNVWWDLKGKGWTIIDQLNGVRPAQNTLWMKSPFVLQSVKPTTSDDLFPLPVMDVSQTGGAVEWHDRNLALRAVSRIEDQPSALPVSGWNAKFENIQWNLSLPPGVSVLTASGVDTQSGTWTSNWSIADIFLMALLLALSWYFGGALMSLSMGFLGLIAFHTEWFPGWLLGSVLLLGLIKQWYRRREQWPSWLSWLWRILMVLLLAQSFLFILQRIDYALYPQWSKQSGVLAWLKQSSDTQANNMASAPGEEQAALEEIPIPVSPAPASLSRSKSPISDEDLPIKEVNDRALSIAAGPSQPNWPSQWNGVSVGWHSSVGADASWKLWVIPAWLTRLGSLLSALLLALVLIRLAYIKPHPWFDRVPRLKRQLWVLSFLCITVNVHATTQLPERASVPSVEATEEVHSPSSNQAVSPPVVQGEPWWYQKLKEVSPPNVVCQENCNQINQVILSRNSQQIQLKLQVHAQQASELALPSVNQEEARLSALTVGGKAASGLLLKNGQWTTWVEEGIHEYIMIIELRSDNGVITWPSTPGTVLVESGDWAGIVRQKLTSNTLGWVTSTTVPKNDAQKTLSVLPFVQVRRVLRLNSEWKLQTTVQRIAPSQGPLVVSVPLLPGEAPEKDWMQENGQLQVVLDAAQQEVSWNSHLAMKSPLILTPISLKQGQEQWQIQADSRWKITANGLSPRSDNSWLFMPLPNEKLNLTIEQPPLRKGAVGIIEEANALVVMTDRNQEATLRLKTLANSNTDLNISTPKGWTLDQVGNFNGADLELLPIREKDGKVQLPLLSGHQEWQIKWISAEGVSIRTQTPQFALSLPTYNVTISPALGSVDDPNRWVVALGGDGLRPIAMHLPYIMAAFLIGLVLGHLPYSPFKPYQWGIIGVGLVGEHLWCALFFTMWVFALQRFWLTKPFKDVKPIVKTGLLLWGALSLCWLFLAILNSLRTAPSLHLKGWGTQLTWYVDRVGQLNDFPQAILYSFPLWVYQGLMLLWSLWVIRLLVLGVKYQWARLRHDDFQTPPMP